jgi:hypothetical protein
MYDLTFAEIVLSVAPVTIGTLAPATISKFEIPSVAYLAFRGTIVSRANLALLRA